MNAFYRAVLISVFAILFTGCSNKFELVYEPIIQIQESHDTPVRVHSPPAHETIVSSEPKKGMNIKFGEVSYDSFSSWLKHAFESELKQAGYSPKHIEEDSPYSIELSPLKMEGKSMGIEISVKEGDQLLFSKAYQSNKPLEAKLYRFLFGPKSTYNKVLNQALQDICTQFIADLNQELISEKH